MDTPKDSTPDFINNDIDLTLNTDFNYDIKSPNFKEKKKKILEKEKKEFYTDITNGKIEFKSLNELQNEYGNYLKLLDDIETVDNTKYNLKWGIIKNEYYIFIGQFSREVRCGKGLYITPFNIFAGEFRGHWQSGKVYTYNKNFQKLFYCLYENGYPKGNPVPIEQELEEIEKKKKEEEDRLKKEQERIKKIKEEKEALLKKKEKDLVIFLINPVIEKKKE